LQKRHFFAVFAIVRAARALFRVGHGHLLAMTTMSTMRSTR